MGSFLRPLFCKIAYFCTMFCKKPGQKVIQKLWKSLLRERAHPRGCVGKNPNLKFSVSHIMTGFSTSIHRPRCQIRDPRPWPQDRPLPRHMWPDDYATHPYTPVYPPMPSGWPRGRSCMQRMPTRDFPKDYSQNMGHLHAHTHTHTHMSGEVRGRYSGSAESRYTHIHMSVHMSGEVQSRHFGSTDSRWVTHEFMSVYLRF